MKGLTGSGLVSFVWLPANFDASWLPGGGVLLVLPALVVPCAFGSVGSTRKRRTAGTKRRKLRSVRFEERIVVAYSVVQTLRRKSVRAAMGV